MARRTAALPPAPAPAGALVTTGLTRWEAWGLRHQLPTAPFSRLPLWRLTAAAFALFACAWLAAEVLIPDSVYNVFVKAGPPLPSPVFIMVQVGFMLLLARLTALDFRLHRLADVYVLPLWALGLVIAFLSSPLTTALVLFGASVAVVAAGIGLHWLIGKATGRNGGIGGGDIKLIAALVPWFGAGLCAIVLLACLLALPHALLRPRSELPFGAYLSLAAGVFSAALVSFFAI